MAAKSTLLISIKILFAFGSIFVVGFNQCNGYIFAFGFLAVLVALLSSPFVQSVDYSFKLM